MSRFSRRRFLIAAPGAAVVAACGGSDDPAPLPAPAPAPVPAPPPPPPPPPPNTYRQSNLAANKASYSAGFTFADMVNAWGISIRPQGAGGHFWVTAGGKSYEFVGDVSASPNPQLRTLFQDALTEVTLPGADALLDDTTIGKATGTVFNGAELGSDKFVVTGQTAIVNGVTVSFDGSARFIFATDSGVLSAWTERAVGGALVRVNGPAAEVFDGGADGMQFFGIAIRPTTWDALWAADFGEDPQLRQFDKTWKLVPTQGFINPFATGPLVDANDASKGRKAKPGDPVPFNIQVVGERVFVAYCISQPLKNEQGTVIDASKFYAGEEDALDAEQEKASGDKPNKGKLVEFDLNGRQVRIYADDGRLNAPWGVAIAPANFGPLSNRVLVGNFGGAGRIAAYDLTTGAFVDFLRDEKKEIVGIAGLWGLLFGNGESLGDANALYFAAGPEDEEDGLFGSLRHVG